MNGRWLLLFSLSRAIDTCGSAGERSCAVRERRQAAGFQHSLSSFLLTPFRKWTHRSRCERVPAGRERADSESEKVSLSQNYQNLYGKGVSWSVVSNQSIHFFFYVAFPVMVNNNRTQRQILHIGLLLLSSFFTLLSLASNMLDKQGASSSAAIFFSASPPPTHINVVMWMGVFSSTLPWTGNLNTHEKGMMSKDNDSRAH